MGESYACACACACAWGGSGSTCRPPLVLPPLVPEMGAPRLEPESARLRVDVGFELGLFVFPLLPLVPFAPLLPLPLPSLLPPPLPPCSSSPPAPLRASLSPSPSPSSSPSPSTPSSALVWLNLVSVASKPDMYPNPTPSVLPPLLPNSAVTTYRILLIRLYPLLASASSGKLSNTRSMFCAASCHP